MISIIFNKMGFRSDAGLEPALDRLLSNMGLRSDMGFEYDKAVSFLREFISLMESDRMRVVLTSCRSAGTVEDTAQSDGEDLGVKNTSHHDAYKSVAPEVLAKINSHHTRDHATMEGSEEEGLEVENISHHDANKCIAPEVLAKTISQITSEGSDDKYRSNG